ncbi:MAG TPA: ABC transporter substrate-binding protein [Dictyobacter sp.]|jgi:NitT/TauT family transport system substrate-binding protein|nr:ABC transporter substrate-binding protein [Dictyobacter sp.]
MRAFSRPFTGIIALVLFLAFSLAACGTSSASSKGPVTVNLGYFPNITHAIALVGVQRGTFQQAIGPNKLTTHVFNAGPDEIQALLSGNIDIAYVGPNPAINGYVRSNGSALKIIAGASSGGALFIVRPGAHITSPADLNGKKIADPQQGGTQDISLRHYLQQHNLKTTQQGGTVNILPMDNATILNEFKAGQIDGAWVPEPYASRLIIEDHGTVFVDERNLWPNKQFTTTDLIVRTAFLNAHPDIVKELLQAHVETAQYINNNLSSAITIVNNQLKALTQKSYSTQILDSAFHNLSITYDPLVSTLYEQANDEYTLGFLGSSKPDVTNIVDLDPLNSVLASKGLPKITTS